MQSFAVFLRAKPSIVRFRMIAEIVEVLRADLVAIVHFSKFLEIANYCVFVEIVLCKGKISSLHCSFASWSNLLVTAMDSLERVSPFHYQLIYF